MKKLKTFKELNELSKELIDKTSDAMISKGQPRRAKNLVDTYNKTNYKFDQFIDKQLFNKEFIGNIKIEKTTHKDKSFDVIEVYVSNRQEFNTSHGTLVYYINEDKWVGLPHKNYITRQDVRTLGKIAAVVNPDTKYLKGTGDIEVGEY